MALPYLILGALSVTTQAQASELSDITDLASAFMACGVVCGGLPFAVRFLWRLFQSLLGGPTTRD